MLCAFIARFLEQLIFNGKYYYGDSKYETRNDTLLMKQQNNNIIISENIY